MDWMPMLLGLGKAFLDMCTPYGIFLISMGVAIGILGGALPGVSTTMTVALLAVVTYKMDPLWAIVMLSACQLGGTYGGSISATVLNIPGHACLCPNGHRRLPTDKKGRG